MRMIRELWNDMVTAKRYKPKANDSESDQRIELIQEIEAARKEWEIAQMKLDYVLDKDQIDYAIYALEAAEKRYEMLLRTAKRLNISRMDEETGRIVGGNQ